VRLVATKVPNAAERVPVLDRLGRVVDRLERLASGAVRRDPSIREDVEAELAALIHQVEAGSFDRAVERAERLAARLTSVGRAG
jgi:hypothetical protein